MILYGEPGQQEGIHKSILAAFFICTLIMIIPKPIIEFYLQKKKIKDKEKSDLQKLHHKNNDSDHHVEENHQDIELIGNKNFNKHKSDPSVNINITYNVCKISL